jgi:hypothetical protein
MALIVSPRDRILQIANLSIQPDLTQEEIVALEKEVEAELNVSALVENIGGIGLYPTMVIESSYLPWLIEVVSHEWAHNYLTMRPLGLNYFASSELRTMNETTASIVGVEVSNAVLEKYYPDLLPPPPEPAPAEQEEDAVEETVEEEAPPIFDFRQEMYLTRVHVDQLLEEGKIEQAELYMELRRRFLWDNGYRIRRLNQAYFAFHGAYADASVGAAGTDPVGPAVRALREKSGTLSEFLFRISWMTTFEELQEVVDQ